MAVPGLPVPDGIVVGQTDHVQDSNNVGLALNYLGFDSQGANKVLATPDGAPGAADFRLLVAADIPNLAASKITSGQLALARGGTNADLSATGGAGQVLKQVSAGAAVTVGLVDAADLAALSVATMIGGGGYNVNSSGQTRYYALFCNQTNATEASVQAKIPSDLTLVNLHILSITAQPASGSLVLTVFKNGVATALTVTINASDPAGFYSDTNAAHAVAFAAGDTISVQAVNNATANSASIQTVTIQANVKLF